MATIKTGGPPDNKPADNFSMQFVFPENMTADKFNEMDEILQGEILSRKGVHIANRDDEVYLYILYQLNAFYVEIWFHKEFDVVYKYLGFDNTDRLDPYLEHISIYPLGVD